MATSNRQLCDRYEQLYTGVISDTLDELGRGPRALPTSIAPLTLDMTVAGLAFPVCGHPDPDCDFDENIRRFLRMLGDAPANGEKGWDIGGKRQLGAIYMEQNDEKSVFPCQNSMFFSLTPVNNRIDLSSVPVTTQIQLGGGLHNGTQVVDGDVQLYKGDVDLGGGDLANVAKYSGDGDVSNDTMYFDTDDLALKYKDATGTIHVLTTETTEGNDSPGDDDGPEPDVVHYTAANTTITPDGDLETDGLSTWNLDEDGDLVELESGGSVGGDIWLGWDAINLYFQAAIDDPVHLQPYEPGDMFRADAIQFAIAPGAEAWEEFVQYTFARNDDGTQVYGQIQPGSQDASERDFDAAVVRDDAAEVTRYEIAIPWAELDPLGGFDPSSDEWIGIDWAILDNDGEREDNIDRFVRWDVTGGSAITGGKESDQLKVGRLVD